VIHAVQIFFDIFEPAEKLKWNKLLHVKINERMKGKEPK